MKRKIIVIISVIIAFLGILTITVNAALSGYASSIGTTYDNINTQQSIERAAWCYEIYGYSPSFSVMDPSYLTRLSNMSAKVQFYNEHGNVTLIRGTNSGIRVGSDLNSNGAEYIGTDSFNSWANAGTVLVTYVACLTAGDGELNTGSLTYQTALKGAEIVLGFKESIGTTSAAEWANNFNTRLADGYGIYDSAEFANLHTYNDSRVKNWHIVHHGDANLNLSGETPTPYHTKANTELDDKNILKNLKIKTSLKESNINSIISSVNKKFNINDYEIVRTEGAGETDITTGKTTNKQYIDLKYKIGDFVTKSGYVVVLENDKVTAIYDNTIDSLNNIELQKQNINNYKIDNLEKTFDKESYINKAINQVKNGVPSEFDVNVTKTTTSYYYDIDTSKKYLVVTVSSELSKDGMISISEEPVYYELNQ